MFYSTQILARKGPLGLVWMAAHMDRGLKRSQVHEASIPSTVDVLLSPEAPLALRLSGQLLLGVCRIYSRKVSYLLQDCQDALVKIRLAFRPEQVAVLHKAAAAAAAKAGAAGCGAADAPAHTLPLELITLPDGLDELQMLAGDAFDLRALQPAEALEAVMAGLQASVAAGGLGEGRRRRASMAISLAAAPSDSGLQGAYSLGLLFAPSAEFSNGDCSGGVSGVVGAVDMNMEVFEDAGAPFQFDLEEVEIERLRAAPTNEAAAAQAGAADLAALLGGDVSGGSVPHSGAGLEEEREGSGAGSPSSGLMGAASRERESGGQAQAQGGVSVTRRRATAAVTSAGGLLGELLPDLGMGLEDGAGAMDLDIEFALSDEQQDGAANGTGSTPAYSSRSHGRSRSGVMVAAAFGGAGGTAVSTGGRSAGGSIAGGGAAAAAMGGGVDGPSGGADSGSAPRRAGQNVREDYQHHSRGAEGIAEVGGGGAGDTAVGQLQAAGPTLSYTAEDIRAAAEQLGRAASADPYDLPADAGGQEEAADGASQEAVEPVAMEVDDGAVQTHATSQGRVSQGQVSQRAASQQVASQGAVSPVPAPQQALSQRGAAQAQASQAEASVGAPLSVWAASQGTAAAAAEVVAAPEGDIATSGLGSGGAPDRTAGGAAATSSAGPAPGPAGGAPSSSVGGAAAAVIAAAVAENPRRMMTRRSAAAAVAAAAAAATQVVGSPAAVAGAAVPQVKPAPNAAAPDAVRQKDTAGTSAAAVAVEVAAAEAPGVQARAAQARVEGAAGGRPARTQKQRAVLVDREGVTIPTSNLREWLQDRSELLDPYRVPRTGAAAGAEMVARRPKRLRTTSPTAAAGHLGALQSAGSAALGGWPLAGAPLAGMVAAGCRPARRHAVGTAILAPGQGEAAPSAITPAIQALFRVAVGQMAPQYALQMGAAAAAAVPGLGGVPGASRSPARGGPAASPCTSRGRAPLLTASALQHQVGLAGAGTPAITYNGGPGAALASLFGASTGGGAAADAGALEAAMSPRHAVSPASRGGGGYSAGGAACGAAAHTPSYSVRQQSAGAVPSASATLQGPGAEEAEGAGSRPRGHQHPWGPLPHRQAASAGAPAGALGAAPPQGRPDASMGAAATASLGPYGSDKENLDAGEVSKEVATRAGLMARPLRPALVGLQPLYSQPRSRLAPEPGTGTGNRDPPLGAVVYTQQVPGSQAQYPWSNADADAGLDAMDVGTGETQHHHRATCNDNNNSLYGAASRDAGHHDPSLACAGMDLDQNLGPGLDVAEAAGVQSWGAAANGAASASPGLAATAGALVGMPGVGTPRHDPSQIRGDRIADSVIAGSMRGYAAASTGAPHPHAHLPSQPKPSVVASQGRGHGSQGTRAAAAPDGQQQPQLSQGAGGQLGGGAETPNGGGPMGRQSGLGLGSMMRPQQRRLWSFGGDDEEQDAGSPGISRRFDGGTEGPDYQALGRGPSASRGSGPRVSQYGSGAQTHHELGVLTAKHTPGGIPSGSDGASPAYRPGSGSQSGSLTRLPSTSGPTDSDLSGGGGLLPRTLGELEGLVRVAAAAALAAVAAGPGSQLQPQAGSSQQPASWQPTPLPVAAVGDLDMPRGLELLRHLTASQQQHSTQQQQQQNLYGSQLDAANMQSQQHGGPSQGWPSQLQTQPLPTALPPGVGDAAGASVEAGGDGRGSQRVQPGTQETLVFPHARGYGGGGIGVSRGPFGSQMSIGATQLAEFTRSRRRKDAARCFYDMLVLKNRGLVDLHQEPYGHGSRHHHHQPGDGGGAAHVDSGVYGSTQETVQGPEGQQPRGDDAMQDALPPTATAAATVGAVIAAVPEVWVTLTERGVSAASQRLLPELFSQ